MPRYCFMIPVRAIGSYRLEGEVVISTGITLIHDGGGAYIARVGNLEASTPMEAYELAKSRAEAFFGYLALLGHDTAFILDGIERLGCKQGHPLFSPARSVVGPGRPDAWHGDTVV